MAPHPGGSNADTVAAAPIATPSITTTPTGTATAKAGATSSPTGAGPTPIPEPVLPRHYVVLIVVDAGSPSYFSDPGLPHIHALMSHGVTYNRATVGELESSTPDVHVTFGTGTLPRENGFLGFGWAAPDTRKSIDFRTLLANRAIDPVLKALPLPSVATRLHQYLPQSVSIAASGHKDYAVVGLGGGTATYELYGKFTGSRFIPDFMHAPPPLSKAERQALNWHTPLQRGQEDAWALRYSLAVARRVRPKLLMINLPEIDTYGHWNGPANKAVFQALMQNVDRGIGQIEATYKSLGLLSRTDFIITADHGMMESRAARNWNLVGKAAHDVGARVVRGDTEGGAVWLENPTQAKAVAVRLTAMKPAHVDAIFYRSGPGLKYSYLQASPMNWLIGPQVATALQDLVNTTAGANGPDIWVLYRENYTVVPRNVAGTWKGTHGGPSWKVQHVPLILSGPDIQRGFHSRFPAQAIDIAPTMERMLGLPPIHRDGVLLADALTNATHAELAAQNAMAATIGPDVDAMQEQSVADDQIDTRHWGSVPKPLFLCILPPLNHFCPARLAPPTNQ